MYETDFNKAYETVKQLIQDFHDNIDFHMSPEFLEIHARQEYIDNLFIALGWDVLHKYQKNPLEREVKTEKPQKQVDNVNQKRADYSFAIAPNFKQTLFFVEAKKPSRALRNNKSDYFQTAKYGWNAGTGISVLTDFQEFVIIDCRFKPELDSILNAEIEYFLYTDLLDEQIFEKIYWLFSREAVLAGNLASYIEELPKRKGNKKSKGGSDRFQSIDETFLNYIDNVRLKLAQAFYNTNQNTDAYILTEATQKTIDRIVFIKFLEDKFIETEPLIHNISISKNPWKTFVDISKNLDAKYNGVVFKSTLIDSNKFNAPSSEIFQNICSDIDHINSPYNFNYFPIHILGNIYEGFLGKIVVINDGKIDIQEKPAVRKAGGVFYTPKNVVDYIVKNTVGKCIQEKTPKQISTMAFADISCGSGSFLIGIFEYLLDYHQKFYNSNPEQAKKDGCTFEASENQWYLTLKQKQQILLNNIYGVDIDFQATEVTQLSLFLKMLEYESLTSANELFVLFHEKILPNLSNNIKCGNSLVSTDILTTKLDLELENERNLNPFNFSQSFHKVLNNGGFDAIIGNPPYVFTRDVDIPDFVKDYYWNYYKLSKPGKSRANQSGKVNLYVLFILRALKFLKNNGYLSYIIPNGILRTTTYDTCRKYLIDSTHIDEIVDLKDGVFKGVTASTLILTLNNISKKSKTRIVDANYKIDRRISEEKVTYLNQKDYKHNTSYTISLYISSDELLIFQKMKKSKTTFKTITKDIIEGIVALKPLISSNQINSSYVELLEGKDIKSFYIRDAKNFLLWDKKKIHRARPDYLWDLEEKILIQRISGGITPLVSAIDREKRRAFASLNILVLNQIGERALGYPVINALLNSNLINFFYAKNFTNSSTLTVNIAKTFLEEIPIPNISSWSKEVIDELTNLNKNIEIVKKQISEELSDRNLTYLNQKYLSYKFQLDQIIYQIYSLDEKEVDIIETYYSESAQGLSE